MKPQTLKIALILSVALNLSVLGAAGLQLAWGGRLAVGDDAAVAGSLRLDEEQRRRWHEMEEGSKKKFRESWSATRLHREKLIRSIFSDRPNPEAIEAERRAILQLLAQQQQHVIAQLLAKRDILTVEQRAALAELLIKQKPAATIEQLLRHE